MNKTVQCGICQKRFKAEFSLVTDVKTRHPSNPFRDVDVPKWTANIRRAKGLEATAQCPSASFHNMKTIDTTKSRFPINKRQSNSSPSQPSKKTTYIQIPPIPQPEQSSIAKLESLIPQLPIA